jgi:hypothetical protein
MTALQILILWIAKHDDDVINQQYIQQKALMLLDREKEIMVDFALHFDEFADREHAEKEFEILFEQKNPI